MNTDFKIRFDVADSQIDANILILNLLGITDVIQEINRELNTGKKIKTSIKALEKGSFIIHIDLIETALDAVKNLFTKENIEAGGAIIGILVGILELKSFLKGKKETLKKEQGNTVEITNKDNEVKCVNYNVYNIYNSNVKIEKALSNSFKEIEDDGNVNGYEILDKENKPLIRIEKDEFEHIAKEKEFELAKNEREIKEIVKLNILKASFESNLKWEFIYLGNTISAKINDSEFNLSIDKGKSFAKGDILEVELITKQEINEAVNTYINKSYKIARIISHIKREEQSSMNLE